ncbi:MAG: glycerol kinase, partial [Planctomycetales bacterium]|nr:glycerol kinase [Planctomycetales bacterium]
AETTALGAAYLAGLEVGYWQNLDDLRRNWQRSAEFQPQWDAAQRDARYARWQRAVGRATDWVEH